VYLRMEDESEDTGARCWRDTDTVGHVLGVSVGLVVGLVYKREKSGLLSEKLLAKYLEQLLEMLMVKLWVKWTGLPLGKLFYKFRECILLTTQILERANLLVMSLDLLSEMLLENQTVTCLGMLWGWL
jgi:hypothetical protein